MSSGLDIGVLPTGPVPSDTLARLRETFADSTLPYEVDVVDARTRPMPHGRTSLTADFGNTVNPTTHFAFP